MPSASILNVCFDASLLNSRSRLLQSAGYIVATAESTGEAIKRFRDGDFDLVLLCHSISPEDRRGLAALIRASGSTTPLALISEFGEHDKFIGSTIENEPRHLLEGIRALLATTLKLHAEKRTSFLEVHKQLRAS